MNVNIPQPATRNPKAHAATRYPVLFEDDLLIAIHKPEGVLSHPNPSERRQSRSAFEGPYHFQERCFDTPRGLLWLIHRLDQDTSGILLAAKSLEIAEKCKIYFEKQLIQKTYLALVAGKPSPPSGFWRDHLEKRTGHHKVRSVIRQKQTPNAELRYKIRNSEFRIQNSCRFSLLEITLLTGRTHQIRLQAAARGYPIAGDRIYGDFRLNRQLRHQIGLRRLFLHAFRLQFPHLKTERHLTLEAPLPEELKDCLSRLSK